MLVPLGFIVSYAKNHGQEANVLQALNGSSVLGRLVSGYLGDRYGCFNIAIISMFLCAVVQLALWLPAASLMAFAVLFGIMSGSILTQAPVCISRLSNSENYGQYYAAAMVAASLGALSGMPTTGVLLERYGWTALIVFSAVSMLLACVLTGGAKVRAFGWKWKEVGGGVESQG